MLRRFKLRVRRLLHPKDLDDELQVHLDQLTDAFLSDGLTPEDAKRSARARFGNPTSIAEQSREAFSFGALEDLFRDVRFALRSWRRTPVTILAATGSAVRRCGRDSQYRAGERGSESNA